MKILINITSVTMNYSYSVQIFTGFSIHIHKSLKPYGTGDMFLGSFYNQWGDPTATLVTVYEKGGGAN